MVEIVDVGPRDGLQNESVLVSTEDKVHLIELLVSAGLPKVETVSFVNPARVPQMADAEAVMARLSTEARARGVGLVLNPRGLQRASEAGVSEINFVVVVTDSFAKANQNSTTQALIEAWLSVSEGAKALGISASVTLAASFGCPFEGEVPQSRVLQVLEAVMEGSPSEVGIADTIGAGTPGEVRTLLRSASKIVGKDVPLRCHFHNTRNVGLANAYVAVEEGVHALDSSVGGVGGCPFAPRATGNIPTEDVVWMLERSGVSTGIDLPRLLEASSFLQGVLGKELPSMVSKAGVFPSL